LEKKLSEKSNNTGQTGAALANVGLNDECIFSASELAVGDQLMIFFNCIGSTDERSWSEF
jgi:hypothetical protein